MQYTMRQAYAHKWAQEGLIATDERKEEYYQRSLNIPALEVDKVLHFCFIFPSQEGDYQINMTAQQV